MTTITYTTATGTPATYHFTTQAGADLFTGWLTGEGLEWEAGL